MAAITGALAHVRPSYATQRYQQIAVQALLACHDTGQPAPDGFLDELARHAPGGLAPDPRYVLKALITTLADRGVTDPVRQPSACSPASTSLNALRGLTGAGS